MLLDSLKKYSLTDRQAAFDGNEFMSFYQLWRRSEAIADFLIQNFPNKKPVAIFGDKENDMLSCMFAAIKSGRPYVCIPSYYPPERIHAILADCGAEAVLNPSEKPIPGAGIPVISAQELRSAEAGMESDPMVSPENYSQTGDVICIIYTSGSSGAPKGVRLTYENIEEKILLTKEFAEPFLRAEGTRAVNLAAYSFSASLSTVYYDMLNAGCTLYCASHDKMEDSKKLLDYLEEVNPELLVCTPTVIERLLSFPHFTPEFFSRLRFSLLGGEPLRYELACLYHERFPQIHIRNGYGITEASAIPLTCEIIPERADSAFPYYPICLSSVKNAYIMDENGNRITEDGKIGELVVCGKTVSKGYLNRQEQTDAVFFTDNQGNRSFHTGDLLQSHAGYFYLVGRKDNQVKLGGNRFELEDAEANLRKLSMIKDCACAVQTLDSGTKLLIGFIVLRDSAVPKMKAILTIKQELKQLVENYMIPSKLIFLDSIPKNVNLKVDRAALEAMAQNA